MYQNSNLNSSTDSDVFYVEHSLPERSPMRNNTPVILNCTQLSGAMDPETITVSPVASPEAQIITIESESNEPTFPYAFGAQYPIIPPSLNYFNLPPNPFIVLASMAVIRQDQEDSPQSPEPSDPSPISTPPMNLSTIEGWETPHTTTEEKRPSIRLRTSQDGSTGTLQTRHSSQTSLDECLPQEAHHPHRRHHRDRKED